MSSSPDPRAPGVLRAAEASSATAARFDLTFRGAAPGPQAAEARASAQAQGYAAGWAEGKRQAVEAGRVAMERAELAAGRATAERAAVADRAVTAVAAAAQSLERRAVQTTAEAETLILRAALALTETLLGYELTVTTTPGEDALRRALALAPVGRPVIVRLHPADHAALAGDGADHREIGGRTVTLVADPALRSGDAVAECDATTIDARLDAALDRIREALPR